MVNSRSLDELLPQVHATAQDFLELARKQGIDLLVTSSYRDFESQAALFAIGRTTPGANPRVDRPMGDTVTNAQPGTSWHNWRRALDVVPVVAGKAIWNDMALWSRIGACAESVGLEWAGRWKSFKELAHVQLTEGLSLAELLSAHPRGLPRLPTP